jgi:hypothetical protein
MDSRPNYSVLWKVSLHQIIHFLTSFAVKQTNLCLIHRNRVFHGHLNWVMFFHCPVDVIVWFLQITTLKIKYKNCRNFVSQNLENCVKLMTNQSKNSSRSTRYNKVLMSEKHQLQAPQTMRIDLLTPYCKFL